MTETEPPDADEIWMRASENGEKLSNDFMQMKFGPAQGMSIEFDREKALDFADYETAVVTIAARKAHISLCIGLSTEYIGRVLGVIFPVKYCIENIVLHNKIKFTLGDEAYNEDTYGPCSRLSSDRLIPDVVFCHTRGYLSEKARFRDNVSFVDRLDKAYFRGTDTGVSHYEDRLDAPRVKAAILGKEHPDDIDAALIGAERGRSDWAETEKQYEVLGILKDRDPQEKILDYKFQIDIDGNSNAWSACYLKLLTGSPVLKVESKRGYRQWYYDRLQPWINYVPVENDCADLLDKVRFLKKNQHVAEKIGINGRQLVDAMSFEDELRKAALMIAAQN